MVREGVQTYRCDVSANGSRWVDNEADFEECDQEDDEVCRDDPEPHCAAPCDTQGTASLSMLAAPICELHLKRKRSKTVNAHDPNAKSADAKGDVIAGQRMNYTVEYENTGQGTAYGVFVMDNLDAHRDEATLSINEGGAYSSASRLLSSGTLGMCLQAAGAR